MNSRQLSCCFALTALLSATGSSAAPVRASRKTAPRKPAAQKPAPTLAGVTKLEVAPAVFTLDGARATERLVVLATLKDGSTLDVTNRAALTLSNPAMLALKAGVAAPRAD